MLKALVKQTILASPYNEVTIIIVKFNEIRFMSKSVPIHEKHSGCSDNEVWIFNNHKISTELHHSLRPIQQLMIKSPCHLAFTINSSTTQTMKINTKSI